jgi:hypothetical protein
MTKKINHYFTSEDEQKFLAYIKNPTKDQEKYIYQKLRKLCVGVCRKFITEKKRLPDKFDDLVEDMVAHLWMDVLKKYDPTKKSKLYSYLTYCASTYLIRTFHSNIKKPQTCELKDEFYDFIKVDKFGDEYYLDYTNEQLIQNDNILEGFAEWCAENIKVIKAENNPEKYFVCMFLPQALEDIKYVLKMGAISLNKNKLIQNIKSKTGYDGFVIEEQLQELVGQYLVDQK